MITYSICDPPQDFDAKGESKLTTCFHFKTKKYFLTYLNAHIASGRWVPMGVEEGEPRATLIYATRMPHHAMSR